MTQLSEPEFLSRTLYADAVNSAHFSKGLTGWPCIPKTFENSHCLLLLQTRDNKQIKSQAGFTEREDPTNMVDSLDPAVLRQFLSGLS
jgi:hypothetical protein